ncbi:MAG: efflux RND transporter permease subunit [Planctomycetota bacterium]|nr:efflux RND transporter permease subunit [Planctomycetota bacterium]
MKQVPWHTAFFQTLLQRPVLLHTLFATCLVVGLIAYVRIPVQMMPDGLSAAGLQIYLTNPGSSAPENEERVARILEEQLRTLAGVESIDSSSRNDSVGIYVEFKADTDMNFAKAEVRDRIERARPMLPTSVRDIGIWSWSQSNLPVMFFALLHPGDSARTDFLVDNVVKNRLEAVDGVGRVEIWGALDDSMRILLDEDKVKAANLDLGALIKRLAADNFALPMGEVEDGGRRMLLRSDMRFRSPGEIETYPIGRGLTIGDIGHVESVKSVRERLFRIEGKYAYYGEVAKDGQANTVETAHRLKATIAALESDPQLRGEFQFLVLFNQGEFIETSLGSLKKTAWEGGAFAVIILFLFLWRVRLTLLVALSIPVSALLAIAWIYFSGGTFNVLTMTGITLAMGMLVDNSIVVIENIVRLRNDGVPAARACAEGTSEVGLAVLLSTLTSVVVFLPLIFMSENPQLRIMFGELGKPLCIALLASLFAALVFLPVQVIGSLGERSRRMNALAHALAPIGAVPARLLGFVFGGKYGLVRLVLTLLSSVERIVVPILAKLRYVLAAGAIALSAFAIAGMWNTRAAALAADPFVLGPGLDAFSLMFAMVGAGLAALAAATILLAVLPWARAHIGPLRPLPPTASNESVRPSIVDGIVRANRALVSWSLEHRMAATIAAVLALATIVIPASNMKVAAFGDDGDRSRVNFWVELEDNFTLWQAEEEMVRYEEFLETKRSEYGFSRIANRFGQTGGRLSLFWETPPPLEVLQRVQKDLEKSLPKYAGHRIQFVDDEGSDKESRSMVTFRLEGPDSDELARIGGEAVKLLESVQGLSSIRSPLANAPPVVRVKLDSELAQRMGVNAQSALENVSWALRGIELPSFQEPGRETPLLIQYDKAEAAGLSTLRDLDVYTADSPVPLSSFSDLEFGRMSRTIERHDGEASFSITARVSDPSRQYEASRGGRLALEALDLPRGYSIADEDLASTRQEDEMKEIQAALALSIVLVFLLMGILFESFLVPISALFTIPYAVLGSVWTLYVTGTAMDSVGWIGIIILVGIVANHGIVLIDRVYQLQRQGMERKEAVLTGCGNRVRPVLMTSLTAVMGLLPLALNESSGEGIDYRALAICVAGGISMSTVFTLWVVPLAYTVIEDMSRAFSSSIVWSLRPWQWRPTAAADWKENSG